jgi:CubicO group peptidase (beta-lactamase class C family)
VGAALDDTVPARRPILVRDLLTFTMGTGIVFAPPGTYPIQRAMDERRLGQERPNPQTPPDPDEWMRRLGGLPLIHHPGERWMYNTGADVLGVLIARASGRPFDAFLRERLFDPLGMKDTAFSVPAAKLSRLVTSYVPDAGGPRLYDAPEGQWSHPPAFPGGGAGLVSTVDDYLAFAEMLAAGGERRGVRILSRPSVEAMTRDQLSVEQKATGFPGLFDSHGWGFCMAVVTGADASGAVGAYGWDGGLGTTWRNDPGARTISLLFTQQGWASPQPPPIARDLWRAARS